MLRSFESLPKQARIWVYQSDRVLEKVQQELIVDWLEKFINEWNSHGVPLHGGVRLFFDRFIILAVNDTIHVPSGCSIDRSVTVLKALQSKLGVDLLAKNQVAFKHAHNSENIFTVPLEQIAYHVAKGNIHTDMFVFNNFIAEKQSLDHHWIVKVSNSWVKRYFDRSIA